MCMYPRPRPTGAGSSSGADRRSMEDGARTPRSASPTPTASPFREVHATAQASPKARRCSRSGRDALLPPLASLRTAGSAYASDSESEGSLSRSGSQSSLSSPFSRSRGNSFSGPAPAGARISGTGSLKPGRMAAEGARPTSARCEALPLAAMALYADSHQQLLRALNAVGREIQVESAMHVTGASATVCNMLYGADELPAAPDLLVPAGAGWLHSSSAVPELAACMAMPAEAVEVGGEDGIGIPANANGSSGLSSATSAMNNARLGAEYGASETVRGAQRWADWLRRIRRKKMKEQMQLLISKIELPLRTMLGSFDDDGGAEAEHAAGVVADLERQGLCLSPSR